MPRFELNFKIMLTVYNTYEGGGGMNITYLVFPYPL